jgi:hypothetical protein
MMLSTIYFGFLYGKKPYAPVSIPNSPSPRFLTLVSLVFTILLFLAFISTNALISTYKQAELDGNYDVVRGRFEITPSLIPEKIVKLCVGQGCFKYNLSAYLPGFHDFLENHEGFDRGAIMEVKYIEDVILSIKKLDK